MGRRTQSRCHVRGACRTRCKCSTRSVQDNSHSSPTLRVGASPSFSSTRRVAAKSVGRPPRSPRWPVASKSLQPSVEESSPKRPVEESSPKRPASVESSPKRPASVASSPKRPASVASSPKRPVDESSPKRPASVASSPKRPASVESYPKRPASVESLHSARGPSRSLRQTPRPSLRNTLLCSTAPAGTGWDRRTRKAACQPADQDRTARASWALVDRRCCTWRTFGPDAAIFFPAFHPCSVTSVGTSHHVARGTYTHVPSRPP